MTFSVPCSWCGSSFQLVLEGELTPAHGLPEHGYNGKPCPGGGTPVGIILGRQLLDELQEAGFVLRVVRGKLIVSPASRLTPELTARIKLLKADLMAEMKWRSEAPEQIATPFDR